MKSKIQSVLIPKVKSKLHAVNFPKQGFTLKQSHQWLKKHKYKIPEKVDETTNFYRYRQKLPDKRYTYTTEVLPNGVELVLMWKKPLEGGAKREPKEQEPEINMDEQAYKKAFQALSYFKGYQLKDLIRQFVETKKKNISYKTATKKRLIDLVLKFRINPNDYIIVEKNPIVRVPANVLKKIGRKQNTDEEQALLVEEMRRTNPIKVITDEKVKEDKFNKGELTLQKHQEDFIKQFVFSQLRGAIIFHGVGSGKTLTAVVSSYFYLTLYPNNKVIVVSPSALLYNFVNGMIQYGINVQDKRYEFLTYEKYVRKPIIARDALLIIDEAHNLRTEIVQQHIQDPETGDILETTASKNKRGYSLLKYGAFEAHKILLLTGTAFVNNIYDIENLLAYVDKRYPLDSSTFFKTIATESNLPEYFGYRISYVPTQKSEYFPELIPFIVPIYMTDEQEERYNELKETGNPNKRSQSDKPNSFFSAERYATNAIQLENNPKISKIMELLKKQPEQKFIIYTVAQDAGIKLLEIKLKELDIGYNVISGNQTTAQKERSKKRFNGYYNNKINKLDDPELKPYINDTDRVLLITKAGAEGVDTKNCQNLILLDHQWNDATTKQIIARAIRYKSHFALPESERYVNVYYLLFCFKSDKPIVDKITNKGFNDWVGAKNELNAETDEYKEKKNLINKVKNKVLTLQRQFIEDEKLKNADVKTIHNYYIKLLDKLEIYFKEQLPELKTTIEDTINNWYKKKEQNFLNSAFDIKGNMVSIHHKGIKGKNGRKAYDENINYFDRIKIQILALGEHISEIIYQSAGYGNLQTPSKSSIDIYLYVLSKAKLKNINEFITNFGGKIDLFETYESKLLPVIKAREEKFLKKHNKQGLTDKEQIKIYKMALRKERGDILDFNFSIDPQKIIKKSRGSEDKFQQFYTSEILANKIKDLGLKGLKGNLDILEPSAGFGNLIKPLVKQLNTEFHIDLIDIDERNRNELKKLVDTAPDILNLLDNRNFLTFGTSKRYDLILMNPPFHLKKGENSLISDVYDFNFIDRAFAFLKEGGRIVAITGTSWSFNNKFDEFDLFNDAPQDYLNMEMKQKGKVDGESSYLKYSIERLEDEPFLGSEGKKIKMTVDIFVIEKLSSEKDNDILGKDFYLSQKKKGQELQNVDIDFNEEQKEPEPPLPKPAPIEEVVKEQVKEEAKPPKPEPKFIRPRIPPVIIPEFTQDDKDKFKNWVLKNDLRKIEDYDNFVKKHTQLLPSKKLLDFFNGWTNWSNEFGQDEDFDFGFETKGSGRKRKGGNIDNHELAQFVDAGYKKKSEAENIDGYVLDKELSTKRDKVYYDPNTGKAVHTIAGTDKAKDWSNNLLIPLGLHTMTNRYKNAEKIQKEANKKYGKDNLSLVSHSQSGNIAQNLAKKKLVGDENITLNPAIIGSHNPKLKVVKSSGDVVSALTFTNKKDKVIKSKTWNPLTEHSTQILNKRKKK